MARRQRDTQRPIESYEHRDKTRVNNPPAGLVTPRRGREQEAPRNWSGLFEAKCEEPLRQAVEFYKRLIEPPHRRRFIAGDTLAAGLQERSPA
ncbi:MAG: hypothetical protein ACK4WM_09985 [Thermoflexales bacterium]